VEAAGSGVSGNDFDVDSVLGPVFDKGILEAGIGPGL
jgi:hypothetical protein